jgi:hypothetical protein
MDGGPRRRADPNRPPIRIFLGLDPGPRSIARLPGQRLGSTWRARSPARSRGCGGSHRCSDDGRAVCAEARIPPGPPLGFLGVAAGTPGDRAPARASLECGSAGEDTGGPQDRISLTVDLPEDTLRVDQGDRGRTRLETKNRQGGKFHAAIDDDSFCDRRDCTVRDRRQGE